MRMCLKMLIWARNFMIKTVSRNIFTKYLKLYRKGCQLPDFSLRSPTFCYTADFSITFLPRRFCTFYHKITSKHPRN